MDTGSWLHGFFHCHEAAAEEESEWESLKCNAQSKDLVAQF